MTGQNAEPVGMKLTLFLSGQEKRGSGAEGGGLELLEEHRQGGQVGGGMKGGGGASGSLYLISSKALIFSQPSGGSLLNM